MYIEKSARRQHSYHPTTHVNIHSLKWVRSSPTSERRLMDFTSLFTCKRNLEAIYLSLKRNHSLKDTFGDGGACGFCTTRSSHVSGSRSHYTNTHTWRHQVPVQPLHSQTLRCLLPPRGLMPEELCFMAVIRPILMTNFLPWRTGGGAQPFLSLLEGLDQTPCRATGPLEHPLCSPLSTKRLQAKDLGLLRAAFLSCVSITVS